MDIERKILAINFSCGYIEDATVSSMWFETREPYTIEEALGYLGAEFFAAYYDLFLKRPDTEFYLSKKCCRDAYKRNDPFCSKCGNKIDNKSLRETTDFELFVKKTVLSICDGTCFLNDFNLCVESNAREILLVKKINYNNILFVDQKGEEFLCYYLGRLLKNNKPNVDKLFSDIFDKQTTKTFIDYESEYGLEILEKYVDDLVRDNKHLLGE